MAAFGGHALQRSGQEAAGAAGTRSLLQQQARALLGLAAFPRVPLAVLQAFAGSPPSLGPAARFAQRFALQLLRSVPKLARVLLQATPFSQYFATIALHSGSALAGTS